ncbi:MAG: response regulator [Zetaproteobacteria bacterium]|nr:response regulator [Zetaproteobacteria bacterium]
MSNNKGYSKHNHRFDHSGLLSIPEGTEVETNPLNMILLDDDPTFGVVMQRFTQYKNIHLDTCQNVSDFAEQVSASRYDLAIIDYYLQDCTGAEVADALGNIPILLISRETQWQKSTLYLSTSVMEFVHKKFGADVILNSAVRIVKQVYS